MCRLAVPSMHEHLVGVESIFCKESSDALSAGANPVPSLREVRQKQGA